MEAGISALYLLGGEYPPSHRRHELSQFTPPSAISLYDSSVFSQVMFDRFYNRRFYNNLVRFTPDGFYDLLSKLRHNTRPVEHYTLGPPCGVRMRIP
jgi:hypothetical protein